MRRRFVRAFMTVAATLAKLAPWRTGDGVVGVVFTPAGRLVLVRHTYVSGWYPPGGGRKRRETPLDAATRELREEIGLSSWSSIEPVGPDENALDAFVVRDAVYRPRRNLEIETVREFDLGSLPADVSLRLVGILAAMRRAPPTATPCDSDDRPSVPDLM